MTQADNRLESLGLNNTGSRQAAALRCRTLTRALWIQIFEGRLDNDPDWLVAEVEGAESEDTLKLISCFCVLLGLAFDDKDVKRARQGARSLRAVLSSALSPGNLSFLVGFVYTLARDGYAGNQHTQASLEAICQHLANDSAATRAILHTSASDTNTRSSIDHLLKIIATAEKGKRDWIACLAAASDSINRSTTSQSCLAVSTLLRDASQSARGASSDVVQRRVPLVFDDTHAAKHDGQFGASVAVAIDILTSCDLAWPQKLFWSRTLLDRAGKERADCLVQLILQLADLCGQSESGQWTTVLLGVLPHILAELTQQQGSNSALAAAITEAVGQTQSKPASTSGQVTNFARVLQQLSVLPGKTGDDEAMNEATQAGHEGDFSLLQDIISGAKERQTSEAEYLVSDYMSDPGRILEVLTALTKPSPSVAVFRWVATSLQLVVQSIDTASSDGLNLEPVAAVCSTLVDSQELLSDLLTFITVDELLQPFEQVFLDPQIFENQDWPGAGGDEGPSQLKQIQLFMQTLQHASNKRTCPHTISTDISQLSEDEHALTSRWITELYDVDGIGDEMIRDTPPCQLLKLAPILFAQSFAAYDAGVIDLDMLQSGLSFFLEALLSYALPRAVQWILEDVQRCTRLKVNSDEQRRPITLAARQQKQQHSKLTRPAALIAILHMLLTDAACPALALKVAKQPFDALLREGVLPVDGSSNRQYENEGVDVAMVAALRDRLADVIPLNSAGNQRPPFVPEHVRLLHPSPSRLEPFAAFSHAWSDAMQAASELRNLSDRLLSPSASSTPSETAIEFLACIFAINVRENGLHLDTMLVILRLTEPVSPGHESSFIAKVRILSHVLWIAAHMDGGGAGDAGVGTVDQLLHAYLLQIILAVLPTAKAQQQTTASVSARRELLRTSLQAFARGHGQMSDTDAHLDALVRDQTSKLWEATIQQ